MEQPDSHDFYRPGHRQLQDRFGSRRLADRLAEAFPGSELIEDVG